MRLDGNRPNSSCACCLQKDENYMTCFNCNFDYCLNCSENLVKFVNMNIEKTNDKKFIKIPRCTKGHLLKLNNQRPNGKCDGCMNTEPKFYLTCLECDFDICQMCTFSNFTTQLKLDNNSHKSSNLPNTEMKNVYNVTNQKMPLCRFNHTMQLNNNGPERCCLNCKLRLLNLNRFSCNDCKIDICMICTSTLFSYKISDDDLVKTKIVSCKANHKLLNANLGGIYVNCDECQVKVTIINYCPICKINLCANCHSKNNSNISDTFIINWNKINPNLNPNLNNNLNLKCLNNHELVKLIQNRIFDRCYMCQVTGLKESLNCKICKYDICNNCVLNMQSKNVININPQTTQNNKCPKNHDLVKQTGFLMFTTCRTCQKQGLNNSWTCITCDYHLCSTCLSQSETFSNSNLKCPQQHTLTKVNQNRLFEKCNVCNKQGLIESLKCFNCNYNICKDCTSKVPVTTMRTEEVKQSNTVSLTCPNNHPLETRMNGKCDKCGGIGIKTFNWNNCIYNICSGCITRSIDTSQSNKELKCLNNHTLILVVQNRIFERCNKCNQQGLNESMKCFTCNYNICNDCIQVYYQNNN